MKDLMPRLNALALGWPGRVAGLLLAFLLGALLFRGGGVPETTQADPEQASAELWTCAMHPQIRQDGPGSCPICGMDLVPVVAASSSDGGAGLVWSDEARALAGLQTTVVGSSLGESGGLRLLGRVEVDERRERSLTTWISGRIDRLHLSVTGARVAAGQVVATLYSPEVYAAHQDLLTALAQQRQLAESPEASRSAAGAALDAARDRLRLLGVPDDELRDMEAAQAPTRQVRIRAPVGGTVLQRMATEGAYVGTGAVLYRVADLSRVWVQLDAYEADLSRVAVGQPVTMTIQGIDGETLEGVVSFIDPTLDPIRRIARVRVELPNPAGRLRPGMFAEAFVATQQADASADPLLIPASAALFTGLRSLVYVEQQAAGRRSYLPRVVRLGDRQGDLYPVLSGLKAGERIVSRGAFSLDADLQIRGGASMMTLDPEPAAAPALSPQQRSDLGAVLKAYLRIQQALATDDLAEAVSGAQALGEALDRAQAQAPPEGWEMRAAPVIAHARHIGMATSLVGAREGFVALSGAIEGLLQHYGNPLDEALSVAFCPMASDGAGARWVQQGEAIQNAYFGPDMGSCGELQESVDPGARLAQPAIPPSKRPAAPAGHVH